MQKRSIFFKKNISLLLIVLALIVGITLGILGGSFNMEVKEFLTNNVFAVFQKIFIKIIGYIAGPLIFITVLESIYNMNSIKTLFGRGRRYLLSFIAITLFVSTITILLSLLIFNVRYETINDFKNTFKEIGNLFKNFVPRNLWDPFIYVNLIQIDILAILFGILFLAIGKEAGFVVKFLSKISKFLIKIMKFVAKIVPLYILVAIINILWNNSLDSLSTIWKFGALFIGLSVLICLAFLLITSFYNKMSFKKAFNAAFKPFLIAFTSANSTVALPEQYKSAKRCGISKNETYFGIPLAISFFKVSSIVYLAVGAVYFYSLSNTAVSLIWIILAVILTTLLTISIAPVSGGGINNYAILIRELSINPAYLPLLIALDPFVDFIITGFNTFIQPLQLINISSKNKQLNKNVLRDNRVILICGAMEIETDYLIENLKDVNNINLENYESFIGKINNTSVVVLKTNIGMENAYKSTKLALEKFQPTELISIGTSGGHHNNVHTGEIIISKSIINYDDKNESILSANPTYISNFSSLKNSKQGIILTSDTWHKTKDEIALIHNETNSDVEEMESFQSCKLAFDFNINFVALRIVSNNVILDEEYIREEGLSLQKELLILLNK